MTDLTPFGHMTELYDTTYDHKDYYGEAILIHKIIQRYVPGATSLLDIGCGTGLHIKHFLRLGYTCTGVDRSAGMLSIAKKRLADVTPRPKLYQKDARSVRLNQTYDAVVSLFHVASYMTSDNDLDKYLDSVAAHLSKGVFIFDLWYGPGVLSNQPETRYKKIKTPQGLVHKIKVPTIFHEKNTVDVMHLAILEASGSRNRFRQEKHTLRYFFYPEIKSLLVRHGFKILSWGTLGMPMTKPGENDWSAFFVCGKK